MIKNLYEYYICHMDKLPEKYLQRISEGKSTKEQNVCDFIAGMTDAYAVKMFHNFYSGIMEKLKGNRKLLSNI